MSALECPACSRRLVVWSPVSATLLVCKHCGGTWIDTATSQRLVEGSLSEVELFVADHVSQLAADEPAGPYRTSSSAQEQRPCPSCRVLMQRRRIAEAQAIVDACPAHGTWFDSHELVRVARWFATDAQRTTAELDRAADGSAFGAQNDGLRHALAWLAGDPADYRNPHRHRGRFDP